MRSRTIGVLAAISFAGCSLALVSFFAFPSVTFTSEMTGYVTRDNTIKYYLPVNYGTMVKIENVDYNFSCLTTCVIEICGRTICLTNATAEGNSSSPYCGGSFSVDIQSPTNEWPPAANYSLTISYRGLGKDIAIIFWSTFAVGITMFLAGGLPLLRLFCPGAKISD